MDSVWAWLNENGTGLGGLAALVTGVIAIAALLHAARDSRDRTRPYLVAQLKRIPHVYSTLAFTVSNLGQSAARDVTVTFEPPLVASSSAGGGLADYVARRYARSFPVIAPGQELSNSVRSPNARGVSAADVLPRELVAHITYRGPGRRRFRESFVVDSSVYAEEVYSTSTQSPEGRLKEIRDAVQAMTGAVKQLAEMVGSR